MAEVVYSKKEELWNAWSHAAGIVLGIAGLVLLLVYDTHKTPFSTLSLILYGISIILLYSASTAYHSVVGINNKRRLRILDHIGIYLLIAGTYSPVVLISLESGKGWMLFWIVWGIAAFGTVLKIFFTGRFEVFSLLLYLVMGWLVVIDFSAVVEAHSTLGLTLLAIGGACYTFGTIFYAVERIPYNHAIWHFFVLAGSVFHFFFIFLDVI